MGTSGYFTIAGSTAEFAILSDFRYGYLVRGHLGLGLWTILTDHCRHWQGVDNETIRWPQPITWVAEIENFVGLLWNLAKFGWWRPTILG